MSGFSDVICAAQTSSYQCLKLEVLSVLSLSKDAAHIYIGMTLFLLAAVLWKRGRIGFACLLPVLLAAVAMETLDLYDDWHSLGELRWWASAHDIVNTAFWPTVIATLARLGALR